MKRPFFYIALMKKITLTLAVLAFNILTGFSQDRIYKSNGNIIFGEVKSVADTGIVYIDDKGIQKVTPIQSVRVIKYAIGNVLPISGRIARKYRDDAFPVVEYKSVNWLSIGYNPMFSTISLGYEYFTSRSLHKSIHVDAGFSTKTVDRYAIYHSPARSTFHSNLQFRKYPSLLRRF